MCHSQRPRSGRVRPLSARVFMRRTSQRGWVAKAYPGPPSLTELDIEDDLSTSSSTDSFFDDDFDTCHQEEKLQNLLTCNTLGVESKVFNLVTLQEYTRKLSCLLKCPNIEETFQKAEFIYKQTSNKILVICK